MRQEKKKELYVLSLLPQKTAESQIDPSWPNPPETREMKRRGEKLSLRSWWRDEADRKQSQPHRRKALSAKKERKLGEKEERVELTGHGSFIVQPDAIIDADRVSCDKLHRARLYWKKKRERGDELAEKGRSKRADEVSLITLIWLQENLSLLKIQVHYKADILWAWSLLTWYHRRTIDVAAFDHNNSRISAISQKSWKIHYLTWRKERKTAVVSLIT